MLMRRKICGGSCREVVEGYLVSRMGGRSGIGDSAGFGEAVRIDGYISWALDGQCCRC